MEVHPEEDPEVLSPDSGRELHSRANSPHVSLFLSPSSLSSPRPLPHFTANSPSSSSHFPLPSPPDSSSSSFSPSLLSSSPPRPPLPPLSSSAPFLSHTSSASKSAQPAAAMPHRGKQQHTRGQGSYGRGQGRQPRGQQRLYNILPPPAPWRSWASVAIKLTGLPPKVTARTIWQAFKTEGTIFSIDIYEDHHGQLESRGKVRFKLVLVSVHESSDITNYSPDRHPFPIFGKMVHTASSFQADKKYAFVLLSKSPGLQSLRFQAQCVPMSAIRLSS